MKGQGTITRHKSGLIMAQLSLGTVNGRRTRLTAYFHSRGEADEWLADRRRLLRGGGPLPSKLPLGDFLADWVRRKGDSGVAPSTVDGYRSIVAHLPPELAALPLGKLRHGHVQAWVDDLPGAPRTVAWKLNMLRDALNDAIRHEHVATNVAALVKGPRQKRPRRKVVTAAECRAILAATATWRYHAAVAVSVGCGLRQGELRALSWADIEDERVLVRSRMQRLPGGGAVRAAGTKADDSGEPVAVPLPAFARDALAAWKRTQDEERRAAGDVEPIDRDVPVFTDPRGRIVTSSVLTKGFQRLTASLGDYDWKDMRTAVAEMIAASGLPQTVARDMLRHADVATTMQHYSGTDWALLVKAGEAIDEAVAR